MTQYRHSKYLFLILALVLTSCGQALQLRGQAKPDSIQPPAQPPPQGIVLLAQPDATAAPEVAAQPTLFPQPASLPQFQPTDMEGDISYFRHNVASGQVFYVSVPIGPTTKLQIINAEGKEPGSDNTGDTVWVDGGKHLQTIDQIAGLGSSQYQGRSPVFAMAFGFHGDERTSDEGTVRTNGITYRTNFGRAVVCVATAMGRAGIGLFKTNEDLNACDMAAGAGPVFLNGGQIAGVEIPFNPLNEDFVQLGWRQDMYNGVRPKTVVAVKKEADHDTLILLNAYGLTGIEIATFLRDELGCSYAIGGDDDGSTQAVWRGQRVFPGGVNAVPDGIAVYSLK